MDGKFKILIAVGAVIFTVAVGYSVYVLRDMDRIDHSIEGNKTPEKKSELKKFSSFDDFQEKINSISNNGPYAMEKSIGLAAPAGTGLSSPLANSTLSASPMAFDSAEAPAFSQTNVQVAGVDEADIVKTDGQYIYTVTKSYLTISKAVPAEEAALVSTTDLGNARPQEIFIDNDNLMVFGTRTYRIPQPVYNSYSARQKTVRPEISTLPTNITFIEIYNISDRERPKLKKRLEFDGNYRTARKIGDNVYFVINNYPAFYAMNNKEASAETKCSTMVPQYREGVNISSETAMMPVAKCTDISYIEPLNSSQFSTVVSLSISDPEKSMVKEVIMGGGENVYASDKNLYLVETEYSYPPAASPLDSMTHRDVKEKTHIYKFSLNDGEISYETSAAVSGHVLNQFSMDEYGGYFRIATTQGEISQLADNGSSNNIFVLDSDLNLTGSLRDIAPGEKIYSARFMGTKGYVVTFKKVDPFFTFDLTDPKDPKIIGKLKIPGYSDYLHPYDENHIIGIGKNAIDASSNESDGTNFAWYQGMKMAMFDVTDFANPKEMFKIDIGDRGTDSPILNDHKALLFSKEKNLLVIPILEAKLTDAQKKQNKGGNAYGEFVYQGAYVFNIDMAKGFDLQGRITHFADDSAFKKSGYYFGNQDLSVKRSLYIGDNLYTVSNGKILVNKLSDLSNVKEIDFNLTDHYNGGYYPF